MADPTSDAETQDDEHLAVFQHVRAALRMDYLREHASRLRQQRHPDQALSSFGCKVVPEPLFGSHHVLFRIEFIDKACWLLKVPANGYQNAFDEMSARALKSEALTMRLIKEKTTVPVPEIYELSDSCDNALGCPYILMEYIDGRPLYDAWFERDIASEVLEKHREQALRDAASALVQLNEFTFHQAGTPLFDADGGLTDGIGPFREVDTSAMLDRLEEEDYDGSNVFCEVQPISDQKLYFTHILDRRKPLPDDFGMGTHKLLRLFIDLAVQKYQSVEAAKEVPTFVLAHPDLDIQNVIVSKTDGHLLGLIDWDGVIAVPQCMFGNERYPSWLTRDWDTMKYRYEDDTAKQSGLDDAIEAPDDTASNAPALYENSPRELAAYRAKWQEIIEKVSNHPQARKLAHDSLVTENLKIAADDPVCTGNIVDRVFEEVKAKTEGEGSQNSKEGYDDFYLYEICTKLQNGKLEEVQHQRLVDGFNALFLHDSGSSE